MDVLLNADLLLHVEPHLSFDAHAALRIASKPLRAALLEAARTRLRCKDAFDAWIVGEFARRLLWTRVVGLELLGAVNRAFPSTSTVWKTAYALIGFEWRSGLSLAICPVQSMAWVASPHQRGRCGLLPMHDMEDAVRLRDVYPSPSHNARPYTTSGEALGELYRAMPPMAYTRARDVELHALCGIDVDQDSAWPRRRPRRATRQMVVAAQQLRAGLASLVALVTNFETGLSPEARACFVAQCQVNVRKAKNPEHVQYARDAVKAFRAAVARCDRMITSLNAAVAAENAPQRGSSFADVHAARHLRGTVTF
mgnify:CR=1 FL=1